MPILTKFQCSICNRYFATQQNQESHFFCLSGQQEVQAMLQREPPPPPRRQPRRVQPVTSK